MESKINRASIFAKVVSSDQDLDIDFEKFRELCFRGGCLNGGIPDTPGIRSSCWKILFKYMPFSKKHRKQQMMDKRNLYFEYVSDFLKTFSKNDDLILEQIDKDVRRTLPEFAFFQKCANVPDTSRLHPKHQNTLYEQSRYLFKRLKDKDSEFGSRKHGATSPVDSNEFPLGVDFHWEIIERILYVYAKLNSGIGYVQGMNELLGPIYYIFATDSNEKQKAFAEADAFWIFFTLMTELKDFYMKTMDNDKNSGIRATMGKLMSMLKRRDLELYNDISNKSIDPLYFAFRWVSLLMAHEIALPDLIRLWDHLFSDKHRFNFLTHVSCAMLILIREDLLAGTFSDNLKLLQSYPDIEFTKILDLAFRLYDEDFVDEFTIPTSPKKPTSPIEELAGVISPALQSLSNTLTGFLDGSKRKK